MRGVELPAALIPLQARAGGAIDAASFQAALPAEAVVRTVFLIVPGPDGPPEEIDGLWVQGLCEADLDTLRAEHSLGDVLLIGADERATSLGDPAPLHRSPLHLHPLPRVVLEPQALIADNTDAALSMDHLLDAFVDRFVGPAHILPDLRLATGYLHHHGMRRVLDRLTARRRSSGYASSFRATRAERPPAGSPRSSRPRSATRSTRPAARTPSSRRAAPRSRAGV